MIRGDRLKARIAARNSSQAEVARAVGVSPQAISKMVSGETTDTPKLYQIARFLQTTPEYLSGESDQDEPSSLADRRLPFHGAEPERDPDLVELDEVDLRYGLGGTFIEGHIATEKRQFSRSWLQQLTRSPVDHLYWARGDGDSMEPTIRSGEPVLVDRSQDSPRLGDGIWVFAYGDIGMIKRLRPLPDGTVEIHSDNPLVRPAIAADGEIHIIGRVIAVVRKL